MRQKIVGLRLQGQRKVHWREESDNRDIEMLNAIRSRNVVSLDLQISHVGGSDDAMLY